MTTTDTAVAEAVLHAQIQLFYASQMQLLDSGKAEDWAETFTEDGVFAANAHPEPAEGRSVIAAAARKATDEYAANGIQRRHRLGMVNVERRSDDEVFAQCYALVIETPRGGQARLHVSTRCDDLLVRAQGRWQVRHRQVHRDDLV